MATIRGTMFFNQEESGWTETYFRSGTSIASETANFIRLKDRRKDLLVGDANLIALRLSLEEVKRDARLIFFTLPSNGAWSQALPVFNCLDVRLEAGTLYRRMIYMRGIPKRISDGDQYKVDAAWQAMFDVFADELGKFQSNGWGILAHDPSAVLATTIGAGRSSLDNFDWIIELGAIPPVGAFPTAARVIVNAPRGTDLRGSGVVVGFTDATHLVVRFPKYKKGPWIPGVTVKQDKRLLQDIDGVKIAGINHRDTGAPFFPHRGRSRVGSHTA